MKKVMLTAFIAVITMVNLNAQDKGRFDFGGSIGLNVSNVSTMDNDNATDSKFGMNFNFTGEYYFSDRWGVKTKLIYDQKGWANGYINTLDLEFGMTTIKTDFKLNYLTIPVMANWHFGSTRKWYLNFGPYVGVLLNAEDSELGIDLKEGFEKMDVGLSLGIGYKFPINENTNLFIEYDSQSGLSEIFKENEGEIIRNGRSSFNIGVLYSI